MNANTPLFYSYTLDYALPGLREKELITSKEQKDLFNSILCNVVNTFLSYKGAHEFLAHHEKRLAERYSLNLEVYENRLKLKEYLETFFSLQTCEGKKKFIYENFVKFETLEFADLYANRKVLEFVFEEFIKNALKFAVSGSIVDFYSIDGAIKMINQNAKRRFCGGSGMGKKLLYLYARKSNSTFKIEQIDDYILSVFNFA